MSKECVHCHKCLERNLDKVVFCLTECHRLYCRPCLQNNQNLCLSCRTSKCRSNELTGTVREDVRMIFENTDEWLRKLSKVVTFQQNQCNNLIRGMDKKIKALQKENSELKRCYAQSQTECQSLKQDVKQLKNTLTQTAKNTQNSGIIGRKPDSHHSSRLFPGLRNEGVQAQSFRSFLQSADTPNITNSLFKGADNESVISGRSSIRDSFDSLMAGLRARQSSGLPSATPNTVLSTKTPMSVRTVGSRGWADQRHIFTQTPHSLHLFTPDMLPQTSNKVVHKVNPFNR